MTGSRSPLKAVIVHFNLDRRFASQATVCISGMQRFESQTMVCISSTGLRLKQQFASQVLSGLYLNDSISFISGSS